MKYAAKIHVLIGEEFVFLKLLRAKTLPELEQQIEQFKWIKCKKTGIVSKKNNAKYGVTILEYPISNRYSDPIIIQQFQINLCKT